MPALWSESVRTKKTSCSMTMKNCRKKALDVCGSVSAILSINSMHMFKPVFSTSRLSCLLAHMHESITNLNWRPSNLSKAWKQCRLIAFRSLKNSTRCSGYSAKSLLIISSVHSKTFSIIVGTLSSIRVYNNWLKQFLQNKRRGNTKQVRDKFQLTWSLEMIVVITLSTSASRASATFLL